MINRRAKGIRNEHRAKEILELAGYEVQKASNPTKWSLQNDLFGLWDLIAIKGEEIRFVQVKTNHKPSATVMEEYIYWKCPKYCTKELWVFKDRVKQPIIYIL